MPSNRLKDSHSWVPLLILFGGIFIIYLLWNIVYIFVLAALFAFIIHPIVKLINKRLPRVLSVIIVYLIILIILITIGLIIAPVIINQFQGFADNLPDYINSARVQFNDLQSKYGRLPASWKNLINAALNELQQTAIRFARETFPAIIKFFTGLFTLVFVPLLAFFMLIHNEGYKRMIIAITPKQSRETSLNLLNCMGQSLWNFIKGELILMLIVGTAVGLGLSIIGMPYAIVFGVIAGLLELIPTFGPLFTSVIVVIFGLLIDPVLALKGIAITITVQLLENIFLVPYIMGKTVGLSPITVAFGIFLGSRVAGAFGAIISIPIAMLIKITILYFYVEDAYLPGKTLSCMTPDTDNKEIKPEKKQANKADG